MINVAQAKSFVDTLHPGVHTNVFLTFDDAKQGRENLVRVYNGTLDDNIDRLIKQNDNGAGVFITVNNFSSTSRKKEHFHSFNAIWQEDDNKGGSIPNLEPSIVVETSPNKFQRYWLLDQESKPTIQSWSAVMEVMVKEFGSDPNAKDISRVMRIPGFYHKKDQAHPHTVKLISNNGRRYAWSELTDYFGQYMAQTNEKQYTKPEPEPSTPVFDPIAAIDALMSGDNLHGSDTRLAMHFANMGMSKAVMLPIIQALYHQSSTKITDYPRWEARYNEIERGIDTAFAKLEAEDYDESPEYEETNALPNQQFLKLTHPPGMLGELATDVMKFIRYPCPEIAIEGALHIATVFAGVHYNFDNCPQNSKRILLAGQGRGKESVKDALESAVHVIRTKHPSEAMQLPNIIGAGDYTSAKQMHLELMDCGVRSMVSTEAGHAQASVAGDRAGLTGYVNQILGAKPSSPTRVRKQHQDNKQVPMKDLYNVQICILHESVPENYAKLLQSADSYADGSLSRSDILFIDRARGDVINTESGQARISPHVADRLWIIYKHNYSKADIFNNTSMQGDRHEVATAPLVMERFLEIEKAATTLIDMQKNNYTMESIYVRRAAKIKNICRVMATLDDPVHPTITHEHLDWAIERQDAIDDTMRFNVSSGVLSDVESRLALAAVEYFRGLFDGSRQAHLLRQERELIAIEGKRIHGFIYCNTHLITEYRNTLAMRFTSLDKVPLNLLILLEAKGVLRKLRRKVTGEPYNTKNKLGDWKFLPEVDMRKVDKAHAKVKKEANARAREARKERDNM